MLSLPKPLLKEGMLNTINANVKVINAYIKPINAYTKLSNAYIKPINAYIKLINAYTKPINAYTKFINAYIKVNKHMASPIRRDLGRSLTFRVGGSVLTLS